MQGVVMVVSPMFVIRTDMRYSNTWKGQAQATMQRANNPEQSCVMAFSDTFFLLGGVLVTGLIAALFLEVESCRLVVLTGLP
jgi:hypothetical protein